MAAATCWALVESLRLNWICEYVVVSVRLVACLQQKQQDTKESDKGDQLPRPALEANVIQHPTDKSQLKDRKEPQKNIEPKPARILLLAAP